MKLATYEAARQVRVGVVEHDQLLDIRAVLEAVAKRQGARALYSDSKFKVASRVLNEGGAAPRDMAGILGRGDEWLKALSVVTHGFVEELSTRQGTRKSPSAMPKGMIHPLESVRLRAPIARPGKITCIGMNYADHAREGGKEPPSAPIFFLKASNIVIGPNDPVILPPNSEKVDYEAEFAVVIGKPGRRISEENAYEHVAGYTVMNDVSARDMQFGDGQWFRGKSCDTFAPLGPWIVTRDEVPDPHALHISLTLNGQTMQNSNTSNLIFRVPYLVSYLSQSLSWETGDLISTGTPPGVGVHRNPPVLLKPGDEMSITVERLGTLTNPVAGSAE
jgi:2-keto-4-pentenoate hydratase/2-oxohepta-3-ene-1,7-dioic acid hydratase in catechol pathway